MARPIVLSNGELHVGINRYGMVHDVYFPYVGLENHAAGKDLRHHVGVWIDGVISWLDDGQWAFQFDYPHDALIGHTMARNDALGVVIEFDDAIDTEQNALLRNIHLINLAEHEREIRLFAHQAFAIGDSRSNSDTVQYLPGSDAILHYRGRRVFVVSGASDGKPFDQYTVGLFGIESHEGTYKDAEDGELSFNNVEHGRVDSTLRFSTVLAAHSSHRVHYWIAAATSVRDALTIHKTIQDQGFSARYDAIAHYWHTWLAPALAMVEKLDAPYQKSFVQSAMIVKSQIDKRGAVMASTDTTLLNYSRDAYAYFWPRDGAYAMWPLIRIGYTDEALQFFAFCQEVMHPHGYLMHKYRADGALGSSWHPYLQHGEMAPPIQEDETAITVFIFAQYYDVHGDQKLLDQYYQTMIVPMTNFLAEYIDSETGLPKPSYDLWEQVYLTTTYTTATVYGALTAAAEIAEKAHDGDNSVKWRAAADDIKAAAHKHLYNADRRSFYKGIRVENGAIIKDASIDVSSIYGSFMYGLFSPSGGEVASAMATCVELFQADNTTPGLPRFENDAYRRESDDITGNVWIIASLWLAQYYIEQDKPEEADTIIRWVTERAEGEIMLPEQVHPRTGNSIAPAPLTWSHAEYLSTLLDTIAGDKS